MSWRTVRLGRPLGWAHHAVSIRPSQTETKRRLKAAALMMRSERMKERCEQAGWLYLPAGRSHLLPLPRRHQAILSRIRTNSARNRWIPVECACGELISLQHVTSGCQNLPLSLRRLFDYRRTHNLQPHDFLAPHPALGLEPPAMLCSAIAGSDLSVCF